jgi:uncharacterized membrane protein YfcA
LCEALFMPPTVFTSPLQFGATCAVLCIAQIVYVTFGFGAGLIAVGSLALLFPEVKDVVVLLLLLNLPAESSVVAGSWRTVSWRGVVSLCAGIVIGIPLGTAALKHGEPTFVLAGLGGFLLAVATAFLTLPYRGPVSWPVWSAPPVGVVSGLLTGLFGTGGPPLIIYYHLGDFAKSAFRNNLMAIFLLMTAVRVPAYVAAGLVTRAHLWSGLATLPAVLLGIWIGHRVHVRLSDTTFRRLVSLLLGAIGVLLLLRVVL